MLPEAYSGDRATLFLRGRVEPYTNVKTTHDGVWVNSNNHSNVTIKLHKRGRAPASVSKHDKTFIDKATLLKEDIDLIQIEAP